MLFAVLFTFIVSKIHTFTSVTTYIINYSFSQSVIFSFLSCLCVQGVHPHHIDNSAYIYLLYLMYINYISHITDLYFLHFFCFILSKSCCKEVNFKVNTSTAETSLDTESSCYLDLASSCLLLVSWTLTTFVGLWTDRGIDHSLSDPDALMIAANNASLFTFSDRNMGLISCTTNGFEAPRKTVHRNSLFMNLGEYFGSYGFSSRGLGIWWASGSCIAGVWPLSSGKCSVFFVALQGSWTLFCW